MDLVRECLDNEDIAKEFEGLQSVEEMQLIALILIRNNFQSMRSDVQTIKRWVTFFGIVAVIGLVFSFFSTLIFY